MKSNKNLINKFLIQNLVAIIAIIVSCVSLIITTRMENKINSKEFEMAENIKYDIIHLIAVIRAIDAKVLLAPQVDQTVDLTPEIGELAKIRMNPSYMYFLASINDEEDRFWVQLNTNMLVVTGSSYQIYEIRLFCNRMLNLLKDYVDFDSANNVELNKLVPLICDMKGLTEFEKKDSQKFYQLLDSLHNQGIDDPDVDLFYAVIHNDTVLTQNALNRGANIKVKDYEIIEKYKEIYDSLK